MAKILSAIPKTKEWEGKTTPYWEVAVQMSTGEMRGMPAYREVKMGDEIPDSEIHDGKKPGTYCIWGEKKNGGKQWQRNDELVVSECAMELTVNLFIAGAITEPISETMLTQHGTTIARAIVNVSKILKGEKSETNPEPKDNFDRTFPVIKTSKELFEKVKKAELSVSDCQGIQGFVEAVNADDYDKAWKLVQGRLSQ